MFKKRASDRLTVMFLPEKYLVKISCKGGEEQGEGHNEAANDGRQSGGLSPAQGHHKGSQGVRQRQIATANPNWKKRKEKNTR